MIRAPHAAYRYPQSLEETDSPDSRLNSFQFVHQVHGAGDVDAVFHGAPSTPTPWPRVGRQRGVPVYDQTAVGRAIESAPQLTEMDPRHLHANQPGITRAGVNFYMGDDYNRTGRTHAENLGHGLDAGNAFPVVYTDRMDRNVILSGHHRATAALLQGRPLLARHVRGSV